MVYYPGISPDIEEVLSRVAIDQSWTQDDQKIIKDFYQHHKVTRKDVANFLDVWAESRQLGDLYLKALQTYYNVFFAKFRRQFHQIPNCMGRFQCRNNTLNVRD